MSRLVGVDIGVFQDDLARVEVKGSILGRPQQFPENVIPFQEAIEVAGACDLHFGHAREFGKILHDLGGDLAGRPPQVLGQLKAKRKGQVSQLDPGRLLRDHLKKGIPVAVLDVGDQPVLDAIDHRFQHGASGSGWNPSKNLHPNTVPGKASGRPPLSRPVRHEAARRTEERFRGGSAASANPGRAWSFRKARPRGLARPSA